MNNLRRRNECCRSNGLTNSDSSDTALEVGLLFAIPNALIFIWVYLNIVLPQ